MDVVGHQPGAHRSSPPTLLGPEALVRGSRWGYELLRARGNSIEGGTTEILKNIVAERVLGLPRAAGMNFDFTEDQQTIKATARELLADRSPLERVREAAEARRATTTRCGGELCELGWPGIAIAEEHGGQGLGAVELAVLLEELGYAVAATPLPRHRPGRRRRSPHARQRRAARALAAGPRERRAAPARSAAPTLRRAARRGAACSCSSTATAARGCSRAPDADVEPVDAHRPDAPLRPRRAAARASRCPGDVAGGAGPRRGRRSPPSSSASASARST